MIIKRLVGKFIDVCEAQAGVDYILGITILLAGMVTVFYIMTNIISPLSGESNELDYVAISVSEYLISNFSGEYMNVVNVSKLDSFLSGDYEDTKIALGLERYQYNITIRDLYGNVYTTYGLPIPSTDTGYVKRLIADTSSPEKFFLEVVVWK